MNLKQIMAALALIIALGGALTVVNQYRWWASAGELLQVAEVSYGTAIARQTDYLIRVNLLIAECQANSCSPASLENLRQQEAAILLKIKKLEADEAKLK